MLEVSERGVSEQLGLSASAAVPKLLFNVLARLGPVELLADELEGLDSAWVSH